MHKDIKAYSLLELMVTIAIIGLLAGIATPIYLVQINKSQVADALNTLAQLELAGKISYEENQDNAATITYAETTFSNNTVTALDAEPVVNGLYIRPGGHANVASNQFVVCVYIGSLNFDNYVEPTAGNAGQYSRVCRMVTANDPIYSSTCGALEGDSIDVPTKYLPSGCECANIWAGTC